MAIYHAVKAFSASGDSRIFYLISQEMIFTTSYASFSLSFKGEKQSFGFVVKNAQTRMVKIGATRRPPSLRCSFGVTSGENNLRL